MTFIPLRIVSTLVILVLMFELGRPWSDYPALPWHVVLALAAFFTAAIWSAP